MIQHHNGAISMTTTKLSSVYAEPTTTPMDNKKNDSVHSDRRPRRLVDYTQYRRDGTSPSNQSQHNTTKVTPTFGNPPRKTNLKMGLPTCFALEASLEDIILGDFKKKELDAATNKADRIHFYFKVEPKNQRKPTRTSSLDTISSRKDLQTQFALFRQLDAAARSALGASSTRRKTRAASL
jgi:hypothetical protein